MTLRSIRQRRIKHSASLKAKSVLLPPVESFNALNIIRARIDAIGVHGARVIDKEYAPAKPLAGAIQCSAARLEFWLESSGCRLELEPLLQDGFDSYQVDSFSEGQRHLGTSKVHQSPLHTELYLEALSQIKRGL
jgi:hypothetical protein